VTALYGFCPHCFAPGKSRERRFGGADRCEAGHTYPSARAIAEPDFFRAKLEAAQRERDVARAEVERLRAEVADLRDRDAERLLDNEHAYDEGYDAGTRRGYEAERAAVVAYLRERANAPHPTERGVPSLSPAGRGILLLHADRIERGEHK